MGGRSRKIKFKVAVLCNALIPEEDRPGKRQGDVYSIQHKYYEIDSMVSSTLDILFRPTNQ